MSRPMSGHEILLISAKNVTSIDLHKLNILPDAHTETQIVLLKAN